MRPRSVGSCPTSVYELNAASDHFFSKLPRAVHVFVCPPMARAAEDSNALELLILRHAGHTAHDKMQCPLTSVETPYRPHTNSGENRPGQLILQ